jgi:hypothetical protein
MIRTAEEFLKEYELGNTGKIDIEDAKEAIIEFAKLHVESALKEASENATTINKPKFKGDINYVVDGDSILNAYPLENIK